MRSFAIVFLALLAFGESRIVVKREVEREGEPKETEIVTKEDNRNDVEVINGGNDNKEVVEFDFNDRDGVLSFGGRVPVFDIDHINERMNEMIAAMLRRIHEMHKRMNETTSKYPDNYNDTKVETIEIGGKLYKKETRIVNKKVHGMTIYSKQTVIVPLEQPEADSVEKPSSEEKPKVTDNEDKDDGFDERES